MIGLCGCMSAIFSDPNVTPEGRDSFRRAYKCIKGYNCGHIPHTTAEDTLIGHIYSDPIALFGIIWAIVPYWDITLLGEPLELNLTALSP